MSTETIITLVTMIVTFICGIFSKKCKSINTKLVPIQNLAIGIISGTIYYLMTKELNLTIFACGLATGGTYDILNNIKKILTNSSLDNKVTNEVFDLLFNIERLILDDINEEKGEDDQ